MAAVGEGSQVRVCLTSAELGRVLDVADAAHSAADLTGLGAVLADTIRPLVGLDVVLFADVRADQDHGFSSAPATFPAGIPLTGADLIHAYWAHCPVAAHSMPGGPGTPVRWTDLIGRAEHRSVPYHTDVWDPLSGNNAIGFTLPLAADRALCFALLRSGSDFPDQAVGMLTVLRPRLVRRAVRLAQPVNGAPDPDAQARYGAGLEAILRLTRREQEVLGLIARGFTSVQAARQLSVATRTVDKHVEHLLAKLDVPCRAAAAALYADAMALARSDAPDGSSVLV
jgi:DNA-binding CsgD family transcriptional regulator